MGRNLALNLADHGFTVALWNREADWVDGFLRTQPGGRFARARTLEELAARVRRPRRILLMVTAGPAVDAVIEELAPLLGPSDVLLDCGNSAFQDTRRREAELRGRGIQYLGVGVSGGEKGARHGASLMVGGSHAGWEAARQLLLAIAACSHHGPCAALVGPDGAGHLVKTVHNAIEYGVMQLLAEAYDLLRRGLGLDAHRIADAFAAWNAGPAGSFLLDISARILRVLDATSGLPLIDLVLDRAGQKGTGAGAVELALRLGVPVPILSAAVDARLISTALSVRQVAARAFEWLPTAEAEAGREAVVHDAETAIHAAMVCTYTQGLHLIRSASDEHSWGVDLAEVVRLWTAGAIVQARLLDPAILALRHRPEPHALLIAEPFRSALQHAEPAWRRVVQAAQARGIPVPALAASLAYFDAYRAPRLPQALIQAQRDAFGAHGYERVDHPEWGPVHTDWIDSAMGH